MSPSRRKSTKRNGASLPDLFEIVSALADARALVTVAHIVMLEGRQYGPEEIVLRKGVQALQEVYHRLDHAAHQVTKFAEGNNLWLKRSDKGGAL